MESYTPPGSPGSPDSNWDSNRDSTPFPFLSLPGELRNKIYLLCLSSEPIIYLHKPPALVCSFSQKVILQRRQAWNDARGEFCEIGNPKFTPALLQVNQQIHTEAHSLLYQSRRFTFAPYQRATFGEWAMQIGNEWSSSVEEVHINLHWEFIALESAFTKLEKATRLKTVFLEIYHPKFPVGANAKLHAEQFFRHARGWLMQAPTQILTFDPRKAEDYECARRDQGERRLYLATNMIFVGREFLRNLERIYRAVVAMQDRRGRTEMVREGFVPSTLDECTVMA